MDRSAEVNGNLLSVTSATTGAFQFITESVDFGLVASVLYDNSGGSFGAVSARNHDLQFSTVPEPSTSVLLAGALVLSAAVIRRRRRT